MTRLATLMAPLLLLMALVAACSSGDGDGGSGDDIDSSPTATATLDDSDSSPTESQGPYSSLEITEVAIEGNQVSISGRTDLPDGASISVTLDVWGRSEDDLYIGVDGDATVSEGTFGIALNVPQRGEFVDGPYEVTLLFTPRAQLDRVTQLVGEDGENLTGGLVRESIVGFNLLELVERIDELGVSVEPPSYTFAQPSEFTLGSAERTLAEYVLAWKDQDWSGMADLATKTWLSNESDPAASLAAAYDFKTLLGFEVTSLDAVSDVTSDVTFVVQYEAITNEVAKKQITAKVIKESAPFTTSAQGEWGVNPISALAETDID